MTETSQITHSGMSLAGHTVEPVNVDQVIASFDQTWSPRIVNQVNDWDVRVAKLDGSFVWHSHPETDELFILLDGSLDIHLRQDGQTATVHLVPHDTFVVPRGTEHCPEAPTGATVMLFEPTGTLNTGDYHGDIPAHIDSTTGVTLAAAHGDPQRQTGVGRAPD